MAKLCQKSFIEKFYNKKKKCLYDVLGDSKIRPNQLFALSMSYPILDPKSEIAKEMFNTVTEKLLNNYGLKTLAKGEMNYIDVYTGDSFRRDMSYHQGITWPWLLGPYYDSFRKIIEAETAKTKKEKLRGISQCMPIRKPSRAKTTAVSQKRCTTSFSFIPFMTKA